MASKRGACFFLFIMACATLAQPANIGPEAKADLKDIAEKLMKKCYYRGYPKPKMLLLKTVFNSSDIPVEDNQSGTLLSSFLHILNSATAGTNKKSLVQLPMEVLENMTNKMWKCNSLPDMIQLMRNCSEHSECYMQAFAAPLSWATLTTQGKMSMDSNNYKTMMWAIRPMAEFIPLHRMRLLGKVDKEKLNYTMNMLKDMYGHVPNTLRTQVANWAKDLIVQHRYDCTLWSSVYTRMKLVDHCKYIYDWLTLEAFTILGPYIAHLEPKDLDASDHTQICEFFFTYQFKSTMTGITMNPSLSKKFLQRMQRCFLPQEFQLQLDKLGPLACYYDPPELNPDISRILLSQMNSCSDPQLQKKRLVSYLNSISNPAQTLNDLGSTVTSMSAEELSSIPAANLKKVLKNLGPTIQWTRSQLHALVKKQLGDNKCKEVSGTELMELQAVAEGLPSCVLKRAKAIGILNDPEGLKNISERMRKGQLMAMLQGMLGEMHPPELVPKLSYRLLHMVSLNTLENANITSLNQVTEKTWTRSQAAYLTKKMADEKQLQFRKMRSALQGITCKMIDNVPDSDTMEMSQAMTEYPEWLSKVQAGCTARKLFATLEKQREGYFKSITEQELDMIPTSLLLHLLPSKVKDLPSSVCSVFLDKMEEANFSFLPLRAPSRPALIQKALLCLANGTDLSGISNEDVSALGELVCEMQPSQLQHLDPDVLITTLQEMASCQHIPPQHRADISQLVHQTFGNPSNWSEETMESVGPLLLLDNNATSALPNKPWMKDTLYFLKSRLSHTSDTLSKKRFDIVTATPNGARVERETLVEPTEDLIEQLDMDNVYWSATELKTLSNTTFQATVETLGKIPDYSADQLGVLTQKAAEVFGPVSQMTESMIIQLECIIQGFSNSDLEKLPLPLDAVEEMSHCGWTQSQMESLWRGVAKYNNLTAQQLGAVEMVSLNWLICGLSAEEIGQLSIDAFKSAVGSMDGMQCPFKVLQQLKTLAVTAFGKPRTWTEPVVLDLGNIVAGLDSSELASLDPSVFAFLSKSCIPLIPPRNLAVLSIAQLVALGPDNAAMLTSKQQAALSRDQHAALDSALIGSLAQPQRSAPSGAPLLTVEGISAFLAVLLMGFLLV